MSKTVMNFHQGANIEPEYFGATADDHRRVFTQSSFDRYDDDEQMSLQDINVKFEETENKSVKISSAKKDATPRLGMSRSKIMSGSV